MTLAIFALSTAMATTDEQQPLVVLDGRVVSYEQINDIPSSDIESMSVLKDESAEAYAHLGDVSNGVIVINLKSRDDEVIYDTSEVMPTFMDGDIQTFYNWFMRSIRYPAEAIEQGLQDVVYVSFVVNREGYIDMSQVEFVKIEHEIFKSEICRVLATSPRWTPGMEGGKAVAVRYVLPVTFML